MLLPHPPCQASPSPRWKMARVPSARATSTRPFTCLQWEGGEPGSGRLPSALPTPAPGGGYAHQAQHGVLQLDGVQTLLPVGHSRVHVEPAGGGTVGGGSPRGPSPPRPPRPSLPAVLGSQPHGGCSTAAGPRGVPTGLRLRLHTAHVRLQPVLTAGRMAAPGQPMEARPCPPLPVPAPLLPCCPILREPTCQAGCWWVGQGPGR